MKKIIIILFSIYIIDCSTVDYKVTDVTDANRPKVIQQATVKAPGGNTFMIIVDLGPDHEPIVITEADNQQLITALGGVAATAVDTALKFKP
jgi:hypothetical protein